MRRFIKKPGLSFITLPGHGRITDDRVLVGDQYARFAPSMLMELLEEPTAAMPIMPPKPPHAPLLDGRPTSNGPLLDGRPTSPRPALVEIRPNGSPSELDEDQEGRTKRSGSKK